MKKNTLLLMIFLLVLTGIWCAKDYAQNTGETGIAQEDWIYQAMASLSREGLLDNYPLEWVNVGNKLSRFEIAYYIKQLLEKNGERQDLEKGLPFQGLPVLQKLIREFRIELSDLGIKMMDIGQVSPSLDGSNLSNDEYMDLDQIISQSRSIPEEPYYYLGQYYKDFDQKEFLFIPTSYATPSDLSLLDNQANTVNIVYQPRLENSPSFLVVKGVLPVSGSESLPGFYLFPLREGDSVPNGFPLSAAAQWDSRVLGMLDEVNQLQQVEYLWQMRGTLPLDGYLRLNNNLQSRLWVGDLSNGLKIGSLLIYSENSTDKLSREINNLGFPFAGQSQAPFSTPVDLDTINDKSLQSLQISLQGMVPLSSQTSIYGGLDFVYREKGTGLENLWPSETKASAGLLYRINDYWSLLTYQSIVNSQLKNGMLSTTSVGVSYNDWISLWLAYQFLDFNDLKFIGSVKFRF